MSCTYFEIIQDYKSLLNDLVIQQFKETNFEGLINGFAEQLDELEQVFCDIAGVLNINTSEGCNLNIVGKIIGSRRVCTLPSIPLSPNDDDYRDILRIRASLNTGSGEFNSIIQGVRFIYDLDDDVEVLISNSGNANYIIFISKRFTGNTDEILKITGAGIGVTVVVGDEEGFRYGDPTTVNDVDKGEIHGYTELIFSPEFAYLFQDGDTVLTQLGDILIGELATAVTGPLPIGGRYQKLLTTP